MGQVAAPLNKKTLNDNPYFISRKDKIQSISRTVVADAFFSK